MYSTGSRADFVYLPLGDRPWPEVFDSSGLQVRHYCEGGVRITVGDRRSSRAEFAAVASTRSWVAVIWNFRARRGRWGMKRHAR